MRSEGHANTGAVEAIGLLIPPEAVLKSVKPDASFRQAVTIMLDNDYSQLPVMTSQRDVKGLVSWKTIGRKIALKQECVTVNDCIGEVDVVAFKDSIFSAISKIAEHDCVLVRAADRAISGIVTASDLSYKFGNLAEPFLKIREIEDLLRRLLRDEFTEQELNDLRALAVSTRSVKRTADLTLGEIGRLVSSDDRWKRLGLEVDRVVFNSSLDKVRVIRNEVMHFAPGALQLASSKMEVLRRFAQFLSVLCDAVSRSRR